MSGSHIGRAFGLRRALGNGMSAVRVALGPMWLGGLLMVVSDGCRGSWPPGLGDLGDGDATTVLPSLLPQGALQSAAPWDLGPGELFGWLGAILIVFVIGIAFVVLLLFLLQCWVQVGFIRLHVGILESRSDAVTPLFQGGDRFWAMVGWRLLAAFVVSATVVVASWPGALLAYLGHVAHSDTQTNTGFGLAAFITLPAVIYVGMGTYLGSHAVALERCGPLAALKRAWALARGNRLRLLWFAVVCFLLEVVSFLGIVFCCVGALVTMPLARAITEFAKTESFLLFTRGPDVSNDWKLWYPDPPHPSAPPAPPASSAPDEPPVLPPDSGEPGPV